MNEIESALVRLKTISKSMLISKYNGLESDMNLAIEALEKQIPKKVSNKAMHHNCPSCFSRLEIEFTDYCADCGQKLDWSVEE